MNDIPIAVEIQDVSKRFRLYHERGTSLKERLVKTGKSRYTDLWALNGVSFEVEEGETVGILGRNGSGKSTLLKCICGVLQPTSGQVVVRGKLAGLLELGAGFQPELTGRDNIYLNGSMLGLSRKEVDDVFDDIVKFAELENFIDNQVKFYSSGMYVRLGFAVAVNVEPDILVVDEVLAVGDERFQRKCMDRIKQFQEMGRTIIFVSHAADQVRAVCSRAVVLGEGHLLGVGSPGEAVRMFRSHLLASEEVVAAPGEDDEGTDEAIDRPVEFTEVTTSFEGDDVKRYMSSGEGVEIRVGYRATERVKDAVFRLEIANSEGRALIRTDTMIKDAVTDLEVGEGAIVFRLSSWPFLDGAYDVKVGVQNRLGGVTWDWREKAARFEVMYEGRDTGVVSLPMEITHVHEKAEVGA